MEYDWYFPSMTFVVLTGGKFIGCGGGQVLQKNWHIAFDLSEKSESSLHKQWNKSKKLKKRSGILDVMDVMWRSHFVSELT